MAKEMQKFYISHGSNKFIVELSSNSPTLKELAEVIEEKCNVPVNRQKLVCKGKTLTPLTATLNELKVCTKSKIMVIGKKVDLAEEEALRTIRKTNETASEYLKKLEDIKQEIDGLEKGFLAKELLAESLIKLEKKITILIEEFMTLLDTLDSLVLEESFVDARSNRKSLISKINDYISQADQHEEKIKEISKL
ncbi:BAG family molecular chaperone regulator 1 isoform X1 [Hydra vulgaris]|uniref:BAG family molecular chaperone regulator 1 n=1 Tax=Hydra vulgaris TaxID=6087 RepID=T2M6L3_HYDVU|nr:BAG family molecular chaperone regulator 1 [Hydra vulgaris]